MADRFNTMGFGNMFFPMPIILVVLLVIVIFAIFFARKQKDRKNDDESLNILKKKFANGEITKDEYLSKKDILTQ